MGEFEKNVYSQFGEDGIIEEILTRLSKHIELDQWCVEFGAWDGVHLSNTCNLIRNKGYSAVLIEGDLKKVKQLKHNFPQENVSKICKFVNFEGRNTLENILSETRIPKYFDFLSIDIDGVDYFIFEGLNEYRPKIVCIEFNPTIPNAVDFVQPKDFSVKQGSSAKAINRLAIEKGYKLVATTVCNLIFVEGDLEKFIVTTPLTLEELNLQGNDPQFLFIGYDGTILSNKDEIKLQWHKIAVPMKKLQILPNFMRVFFTDYGLIRKSIFLAYRIYNRAKKKNLDVSCLSSSTRVTSNVN